MTRILLIGPPGAGKGTQAKRIISGLKENYGQNLAYIQTGQILREMAQKNDPVGIEARDKYWGKEAGGRLVPDGPMIEMVKKKLERHTGGLVFDGFPRNVAQAEALEKFSSLDVVIHLNLMEMMAESRMLARRNCPSCKIEYGLDRIPKIPEHCDQCNNPLSRRDDDNMATIRKRMKIYGNETEPLVAYYQGKKPLIYVDGESDADAVFADLWGQLESFLGKKYSRR